MEPDFTQCYDTIRRRVQHHFPRASADDVVQEACYEAIRSYRASREQVRKPTAFLWTIAKRIAGRPGFSIGYGQSEEQVQDPSASTPEPWRAASQHEARDRLLAQIARLPPKQASVVKGYYVDDKSCQYLADDLGLSRSAIKTQLLRGRRALKELLQGGEDP